MKRELITTIFPLSGAGRRRGFAMPLVILLSLVATILVAAMLDRQGAQRLSTARVGDEYRDTHFSRGIVEVVDTWLIYQGAKPVRDMLDSQGKAMDIQLEDGSSLSMYMRDAQGLLLSDTAGLSGEDAADIRGALDNLNEAVSPAEVPRFTRRFGPAAVSVLTAPMEVLAAVARQVAGSDKADDLLHALLEIRDKPHPSSQDLTQVGVSAELDDAERKALSRLVVVDSGFYRMVIDAYGPQGPSAGPVARYGAYVLPRSANNPRTRQSASGGVIRKNQVIGWERLEVR